MLEVSALPNRWLVRRTLPVLQGGRMTERELIQALREGLMKLYWNAVCFYDNNGAELRDALDEAISLDGRAQDYLVRWGDDEV